MKIIIKLGLTLFLCLSVMACESSGESGTLTESDIPSPTTEHPQSKNCDSDEKELYGKSGVPICVRSYSENLCLHEDFGFEWVLDHSNQVPFDTCFLIPAQGQGTTQVTESSTFLSIDLPKKELRELAKWADMHKDLIKSIPSWKSAGTFSEVIYVGNFGNSNFISGVLDPQIMPLRTFGHLILPLGPKYFATGKDFISYLEGNSSLGSGDLFVSNSEAIQNLLDRNQNAVLNMTPDISYSEFGCERSCLRTSQKIYTSTGTAQFREYVTYGITYRSEWVERNHRNEVTAMLYLNGRQPSLAVEIERDFLGLTVAVVVKDRNGKMVYTNKEQPRAQDILAERKTDQNVKALDLPLVGVCEENFSHEMLNKYKLGEFLVYGPDIESSYFGWNKESHRRGEFWNGRVYSNLLDLNKSTDNLASHAAEVSYALGNKRDIGIIPLSTSSCLNSDKTHFWWQNFKDSGAKVINLSATSFEDPKKCREYLNNHPIFTDAESALWIVAGGNARETSRLGCPQSLAGKENVLVVGAMTGTSVSKVSNFGEEFVDIFARGQNRGMGEGVTSFAAPRVSRVAALLADSYPELTPYELKLILLLSAKSNKWNPLPSRSLGELDEEKAIEIAKLIKSNGWNLERSLAQAYCGNSKSCREKDRRIKIYYAIKMGSWK